MKVLICGCKSWKFNISANSAFHRDFPYSRLRWAISTFPEKTILRLADRKTLIRGPAPHQNINRSM